MTPIWIVDVIRFKDNLRGLWKDLESGNGEISLSVVRSGSAASVCTGRVLTRILIAQIQHPC